MNQDAKLKQDSETLQLVNLNSLVHYIEWQQIITKIDNI